MLGLILIYFIGKYFYDLAEKHGRKKWPFALLGVITYYAGTAVFGLVFGIFDEIYAWNLIEETPSIVINLMALPFGILSCWGTYKVLERNWKNSPVETLNPSKMIDEFGQKEEDKNME